MDPSISHVAHLPNAKLGLDRQPDRSNGVGKKDFSHLAQLTKRRQKRIVLSLWAAVVDLICISTAFVVAGYFRMDAFQNEQVPRILISVLPIYLGIALHNQAHQFVALIDVFKSAWRAASALAFAAATMLLIAFFMKIGENFSRLLFGFGTILALALLFAWRHLLARIALRYVGRTPFAVLCIYDGVPLGQSSGDGAIDAREYGISPDPNDPLAIDYLSRAARGMDCVVVHCLPDKRIPWAFMLKSLDVPTEITTPELTQLRPLQICERSGQTSLVLGSGPMAWNQRVLKRTFDLAITIALMPVLLPLLLLIALVVKIDSPGPVFFKQDRIGLGNRKFKILKFRSMRVDMQDEHASKLTERNDPRVTRVGAFIRKTSLDELPQFINVLLGDMSLVGPRPHAERALAGQSLYWEVDNTYLHRHVVKPGITGLAQVRGHRGNTFQEQQLRDRLNSDLEYLSNWSLIGDIKILLGTFGALFNTNAF